MINIQQEVLNGNINPYDLLELYDSIQRPLNRSDIESLGWKYITTYPGLNENSFGLNPDYYSYTLSKQAMYGLTKMSALSYSAYLRVNGIAPGITLSAPGQDEKQFKKSHKNNLLKSSSTTEEILDAVQLLIKSKSMTGHVILLDGGAHLAPPRRDVGL